MTLQNGFDNENGKKQSKSTEGVNRSSLQNIKSSPRQWDLFIFLAA